MKIKQDAMIENTKREETQVKVKQSQPKDEKKKVKDTTKIEPRSENTIRMNKREIRPKDYEKIREEMIKKFNNSKLKD